jgi:N-acetyl-alpha-D-muramate 1-phosphate uridylyltransferase
MRAMILAAGLGTRLRPLTLQTPKPLLVVGGKPLIIWHIEALKSAGVTHIVINTAWLGDKLLQALGDGSIFGVRIDWSHENEPLETAGGIQKALPLLGSDPFILVNGDVWTRFDFRGLVDQHLGSDLGHLVLVKNPPQHPNGDFVLREGRVVQSGISRLTFSGISLLSPQLFASLPPGKAQLAPILRHAMDLGRISGECMQDHWVDVGTIERLAELDQQIHQGAV